MANKTAKSDYIFAQKICKELLAGNRKAILEVHSMYHSKFMNFAQQRLYDYSPHKTDKVLSEFWTELMNARAICEYKQGSRVSLFSFLLTTLSWRIKDEIRRIRREKKRRADIAGDGESDLHDEDILSAAAMKSGITGESYSDNPEKALIRKEQEKIKHEMLLQLEKVSKRDANLIRMRIFEGLTYEEMAGRELAGQKTDPEMIQKRTNAIKKQFTRQNTGSLAKFRIISERCLKKYGLEYDDLIS